jgi:hypothetical protein
MSTAVRGFIVGTAFLASGCATIVGGGSKQQVTFNSEPADATVTVQGKVLGKTPLTVQVDRAKNMAVTVEKEGYKTFTTQLSTRLNGWFWGNIVIGGLLGSTTDGASGAIHEYSPDQYFVTLVPNKPYGLEPSATRDIKLLMVGSGAEVRKQLANGQGEYVDSLLTLLAVQEPDRPQAIQALNKIAANTADDVEFSNKVIEIYGAK